MAMARVICSVWQKGRHLLSPNRIRNRLNAIIPKSGFAVRRNISAFGKPLIGLPVTTTLKLSGETVVVEELKEEDFAEAFHLLEGAAARGDNVGVDEYRNVGDLLEDFCFGSVLTVRGHRRGGKAIDALLMVGPCLASRTIRPCLASLQVVTAEGFAREPHWRDFFEMAIGYAKQHSFGFSACVTEVYIHCIERVTALRKDGFVICATVPKAGKVARRNGATPVHMHGYLMYKEFGPADNQRPTLSELVEFSKEFSKIIEKNKAATSESTPWTPIPGLPSEHLLRGSGSNPLVLRQLNDARPEEISRYYDFYRLAGEQSDGFSVEEFPTQELFWQLFQSNYNLVFEEKQSGKWMAVMYFARSLFVRSRDSTDVYDGGLIIAREFRNAGFGTQALEILMSTGRSIGCNLLFSDAPVYQIGSISISLKQGCVISGSIPRAIYSPIHGWSDVLLFNFTNHKPSSL